VDCRSHSRSPAPAILALAGGGELLYFTPFTSSLVEFHVEMIKGTYCAVIGKINPTTLTSKWALLRKCEFSSQSPRHNFPSLDYIKTWNFARLQCEGQWLSLPTLHCLTQLHHALPHCALLVPLTARLVSLILSDSFWFICSALSLPLILSDVLSHYEPCFALCFTCLAFALTWLLVCFALVCSCFALPLLPSLCFGLSRAVHPLQLCSGLLPLALLHVPPSIHSAHDRAVTTPRCTTSSRLCGKRGSSQRGASTGAAGPAGPAPWCRGLGVTSRTADTPRRARHPSLRSTNSDDIL